MRGLVFTALVALAVPAALQGAYGYYRTDDLTSINTYYWYENGAVSVGPNGLTSADSNGGSVISKMTVPNGPYNYEVRALLRLAQSGGAYTVYLRASANDSLGATISSVTPGGPAAKAGIKSGDVVIRLNGKSLTEADDTKGRDDESLLAAGVHRERRRAPQGHRGQEGHVRHAAVAGGPVVQGRGRERQEGRG